MNKRKPNGRRRRHLRPVPTPAPQPQPAPYPASVATQVASYALLPITLPLVVVRWGIDQILPRKAA